MKKVANTLKPILIMGLLVGCRTPSGSDFKDQGVENGNGGDILVCEQPQPSMQNKTHMLVDYFDSLSPKQIQTNYQIGQNGVMFKNILSKLETKFGKASLGNGQARGTAQTDINKIDPNASDKVGEKQLEIAVEGARQVIEQLKLIDPLLYGYYNRLLNNFVTKTRIAYNQYIDNQPDLGTLPFKPSGCEVVQIASYFPSTFKKTYIIKQELWDRIDWNSRIGLVLHEVIYRAAREMVEHKTSRMVRIFNFMLAQNTFDQLADKRLKLKTYHQDKEYITLTTSVLKIHRADFFPVKLGSIHINAGSIIEKGDFIEASYPVAPYNDLDKITKNYGRIFAFSEYRRQVKSGPGATPTFDLVKLANGKNLALYFIHSYENNRIRLNRDLSIRWLETAFVDGDKSTTGVGADSRIMDLNLSAGNKVQSFTLRYWGSLSIDDPEWRKLNATLVKKYVGVDVNNFKATQTSKEDLTYTRIK